VRTPMTILKELWTGEVEGQENVSSYVIDLRERIGETCALAEEQLAETQKKKYYNRRTRNRELQQGDLVLLLLPREQNELTLSCDVFTDVPKITQLAKHRVELSQKAPVRSKIYPTPYKMEEVISNEIDDMFAVRDTPQD